MNDGQPTRPERRFRLLTPLERQMSDDHHWAREHYNELDRLYRGEYLLLWKKNVVAHGLDLDAMFIQAEEKGCPRKELVLFPVPDPLLEVNDYSEFFGEVS